MIRRPLGRGLDALINSSDASGAADHHINGHPAAGGPTIVMLEPERIAAGRFQPRRHFDEGALDELANAIRSQGIVEPILVRALAAGNFELIAGERRLRAARLVGLERVPAVVHELDDCGALELSLVENLLREDLSSVEEAGAFVRLSRDFGITHEEIAARIGKSRTYVTNMIRLMELPLPVLEMVGRGELTAGQVRPLLTLESADQQLEQARRIIEQGLSARSVERLAAEHRSSSSRRTLMSSPMDPNLKALAESIQRALKRKVQVIRRRGRRPGRIELEYYSDDDLTALAKQLNQP